MSVRLLFKAAGMFSTLIHGIVARSCTVVENSNVSIDAENHTSALLGEQKFMPEEGDERG
jgi:hypothetical protein